MTNEQRRSLLVASADFFRCSTPGPSSGGIVEGMKGDDKIYCRCGKTHTKRELESVSVDDYIRQQEARRAR